MRHKYSFRIVVSLLIFAPLAFGTVEQWSLTVMEGLSIAAALLLLRERTGRKETLLSEVPGFLPLFCLWVYYLIQIVPLPAPLVKLISPETYKLYSETVGLVEPLTWISLTVHKKATLLEFFRFTASGLFYFLTVQLLTDKDLLKKTVTVVIVFSSLLALEAILQNLFNNQRIFWVRELTMGGAPFGPYVNRNHYAGFMEMVFPVVLSIFLAAKPRVRYRSFREKLAGILGLREANNYILFGFAAVIIATSVFLSLSRSGIACLSLSMILLGGMLSRMRENRKRGLVIMGVFILIMLSVSRFGWEPVFSRFEEMHEIRSDAAGVRQTIWKDSLTYLKDFPLFGTGFGTFVSVYPKYRTLSREGVAEHAHNDYLELLTDGGAVAFVLMGWFVLSVCCKSYRRFLTREESYSQYLFIGSFAGMVAILIHSLTDFNLHIGANGLYFFFLAGLMVSAAHTRMRERLNATFLKQIPSPPLRSMAIALSAVLLLNLLFNSGVLAGQFSSSRDLRVERSLGEEMLEWVKNGAQRATLFDPLEGRYRYTFGNACSMLARNEEAFRAYIGAIRLDPLNGVYLQRMGLVYSSAGEHRKAEELLLSGITCERMNPERYKTYILWLFSQGRKDDGLRYIRMALDISPHRTAEFITSMVLFGINDDEVRRALPERTQPYLFFGDYLSATGRDDAAKDAYRLALYYIKNENHITKEPFYKILAYYTNRGLSEEALGVMQQAKTFLPADAEVRLKLGTAYESLGMKKRAAEEYEKALMLDPGDKEALRRLSVLRQEEGR